MRVHPTVARIVPLEWAVATNRWSPSGGDATTRLKSRSAGVETHRSGGIASGMSTLQQGLVARAEQRLGLMPRLLQSVEILQLATVDLLTRIDAELAQNEVLELVRPADAEAPVARRSVRDSDPGSMIESAPCRPQDLWSHVQGEVALLGLAPELETAVLELAGRLDADGFLAPEDLRSIEDAAEPIGAEALAILRSIEPRGLGTAGPIDAMIAQIDRADPDRPTIEALLGRYLEDLGRNRFEDVARALELEASELDDLLDKVRRLRAHPGREFHAEPSPAVRPDVVVRTVGGRAEVAVDEYALPVLDLNADYVLLAADRDQPTSVRRYLRGKLSAARDLIDAVAFRRQTLCEVTAAILTEQRGFLRHGERAILPLRMASIAERLGIHASTVSRAIAGKYLGHPDGVIALRRFFDGGSADGESRGRTAVQALLREAVAAEDPAAPWSDEQLVAWFAERDVRIARRTIAQHRAELGIPAVHLRRGRRPQGPEAGR